MTPAKKVFKSIKKQRSIPIGKRIAKLYEERNKAYDIILQTEIAIDDIIRELINKI